jgi:TolB protein
MRNWMLIAGTALVGLVAFAGDRLPEGIAIAPLEAQQAQTIDIFGAGKGSQLKIGVPDFAALGDSAVGEAAKTMADVLWSDLDYEHEFYMIPRKSSASIPASTDVATLPFARWTELGADLVLLGTARPSGATLTVEIRLVGVRGDNAGKQAFGQSYQGCTAANARYCAHSIADDMHKTLRGLDGVARTRIAFTSDREPGRAENRPIADSGQRKEIFIMDYDGANVRRLTTNRALSIAPSWGPDGRTLAYASYATLYPDVYLATLDGRPVTRPAHGTEVVHNQNPAISPDGSKIAFTSNRSGQTGYYDIWLVNRDGSDLRNLTPGTPNSSEGAPTWSPSGLQIAFTSDRTGTNQIYVMNADGTGLNRMTSDQHADRPTWSRLNAIAYTIRQPSGHDVAILDISQKSVRILTDGRGSNKQPTVAPNGRHVIFVTTRWGREQLASVDIDGKNYKQLTDLGNNTHPSWSPSPGGR